MSKVLKSRSEEIQFGKIQSSGLQKLLEKTGRFPPVTLTIFPLDQTNKLNKKQVKSFALTNFLTYQFSSSILIPVDTFSFTFVAPDSKDPFTRLVREGDIVVLSANNVTMATGIIDTIEIEVDSEYGEKITVQGRDLMGQLEDHECVDIDSKQLWFDSTTIVNAVQNLCKNTRITKVETRDSPTGSYLFATEPGETKLSALQRYIEPLNCIAFMSPSGSIIVGRPNMRSENRKGILTLSKEQRQGNVLSMRATRSSATIANVMVPIWSGQESAVTFVGKAQAVFNAAEGPTRLYKLGHRLPRTMVVSNPQGNNAVPITEFVNNLSAADGKLFQQYAKREIARQNVKELIVQASVPGHYNDNGEPFLPDSIYTVNFDRGDVREDMYLYEVDYQLAEGGGQKTLMKLCKLGAIVSNIRAK